MTSEIEHSLMISDLHLCDSRPDLTAAFEYFCQHHAARAQQLFILGDLSDAWVGDDDDSETANVIRSQLAALQQSGTQVWLMTGNRDFLMGEKLASDCGLHLLDDPSEVELYGRRMLLMHGDSLCTDDAEYMAFRAQIRNREAQQQLLSQTLEQRRALAVALRAQSKSANATKAEDIMDVNQGEVERVMCHHKVDLLIHGHTHRPANHEFAYTNDSGDQVRARRIVLGDWGKLGWYITLSNAGIELHSFPIDS
ncbi:MAG: UDP-2,3-diacylglucosamine diphosphatase [Gammaproteobacteria bacterium]|nr:UDP-2,3-diacylglucosamine diphosphatase [Gammaproteobacteria bacterium]